MLTPLAICLSLLFAPAIDDDETPPPTREEIKAAVEAIETAIADEDLEASVAAVRAAQGVPADDVTAALAGAAKLDEAEIALAALDVLGRIEHDSAFGELRKLHKKGKKRLEDDAWAIELFRALGRTGHEDAIAILSKDPIQPRLFKVDRARILALGKVRDPESVEALMGMMNSVRNQEINQFMDSFRASLIALTGVDAGGNKSLWQTWWNENKRGLELAEAEHAIEVKKLRLVWEGFWSGKTKQQGGGGR